MFIHVMCCNVGLCGLRSVKCCVILTESHNIDDRMECAWSALCKLIMKDYWWISLASIMLEGEFTKMCIGLENVEEKIELFSCHDSLWACLYSCIILCYVEAHTESLLLSTHIHCVLNIHNCCIVFLFDITIY